jgi:hypothetical protein
MKQERTYNDKGFRTLLDGIFVELLRSSEERETFLYPELHLRLARGYQYLVPYGTFAKDFLYTIKPSPKDFNVDNPLQAQRSSGYRKTTTTSELRSSSIYYHINHSNQTNHSSDKVEASYRKYFSLSPIRPFRIRQIRKLKYSIK